MMTAPSHGLSGVLGPAPSSCGETLVSVFFLSVHLFFCVIGCLCICLSV